MNVISMVLQPKSGLGHLILRFLDHTHIDTYSKEDSSEWLISLSQRLLHKQHITNSTDEHPCPQWDSSPWSQQWSSYRQQRIILHYFYITVATISKKNQSCSTPINFFFLNFITRFWYMQTEVTRWILRLCMHHFSIFWVPSRTYIFIIS